MESLSISGLIPGNEALGTGNKRKLFEDKPRVHISVTYHRRAVAIGMRTDLIRSRKWVVKALVLWSLSKWRL